MKSSASLAKISGPSTSGIFLRHRLFQLLDHSSHGPPLVWIAGPPGTGKTTLAASWLDARQIPSLWYQVEKGDSDPASFFYYLGLAAKRSAARKGKPLPFLTPEYLKGIPVFSRRYFENFFSRMFSSAGRSSSLAIVFDNCHEVPERAPFYTILYEGLSVVPSDIKVILISRKEPPDVFIRFVANSLMKTIGWNELKFTLEEATGMVRLRGHEAPAEAMRQFHEKTDGWAAGIVLLLEGAKKDGIEHVISKVYAPKEIFQYFAAEIFNRAEPKTRDFLLKTSIFPQMSLEMAEALTGNRQARVILSELNARNYFTQKLVSEINFYQYHPLFREFLQFMAGEAFSRDVLGQVQKKAAELLEKNGRPEDAVELLKTVEDWPNAVRLIIHHSPHLARQGRCKTVENWIKGLPETVIQGEPWLLYRKGVCRTPFSPLDSYELFEKALELFRSRGDSGGIFLSLSGLFDSIAYSFDTYNRFDDALNLLDEVLHKFQEFPSAEIEARLTASKLWAIVFRHPWRQDFKKTAERAHSVLPRISNVNIKTQVLHCLLMHHILLGELQTAWPLLGLFRELLRMSDISPLIAITMKFDESLYHLSMAEFEQCEKCVREALELASTTGVHTMDSFLLANRAACLLDSGDLERADLFLEEMAASLDHSSNLGRQFYHLLQTWKFLIMGDFSNSLLQGQIALKYALGLGAARTEAYQHIVCAFALHGLKRDSEAREHLSKCYVFARSIGCTILEFACLLAEAKFAFDKGKDSIGFDLLRKALFLGRTKGYVSMPYVWVPSIIAELCQRALEACIEVDYVLKLIRKRNLMPDPPPIDCEQWPWAIRIYTLGRFEIVKDGQALQFSGKVQKRPLQLLKVLISSGGSEVSEEHITDCLWPDADGDAGHNSFTTTLARLRRLIGTEKAVRVQKSKVSLDPRYCWVDAQGFERIFAILVKNIEEENPASHLESSKVLRLAEKAFAFYRGHFLPADEEEFWSISYRERLRAKFSALISKVAYQLERAGQWENAMEYYRKGLDIDDTSEEFYQRLMICNRELELYANAIEVYKRCKKLLATKLGIDPSPKTEAIYRSITGATDKPI